MSGDLFGHDEDEGPDPLEPAPADAPLSDRMRPRSIEELIEESPSGSGTYRIKAELLDPEAGPDLPE